MRVVVLPLVASITGALLFGYAVYGPPELPNNYLTIQPAPPKPKDNNEATLTRLQDQVDRLKEQLAAAQRPQPAPPPSEQAVQAPPVEPTAAQVIPAKPEPTAQQTLEAAASKDADRKRLFLAFRHQLELLNQHNAEEAHKPAAIAPPAAPATLVKPIPKIIKDKPATDPSDTSAVLERLRQQTDESNPHAASGVLPLQERDPSAPPTVLGSARVITARPPPPLQTLVHEWLASARNAVMSGRIDDARRALQQAQLTMMFSPINQDSAASVAHALEALSNNNRAQSQLYIDQAQNILYQERARKPRGL